MTNIVLIAPSEPMTSINQQYTSRDLCATPPNPPL